MAVAAVTVHQGINALTKDRRDADRNGFLTVVQVAKPADLLSRLGVFLISPLLEAADEQHHPKAPNFLRPTSRNALFRYRAFLHFVRYGHLASSWRTWV